MKYLTLDYIRQHSRIDHDCENDLLELYGNSAEEFVLSILGRSLDDLTEEYGGVPSPIIEATLMIVDNSYKHRSPAEPTNMSLVPYGFDAKLPPFMLL